MKTPDFEQLFEHQLVDKQTRFVNYAVQYNNQLLPRKCHHTHIQRLGGYYEILIRGLDCPIFQTHNPKVIPFVEWEQTEHSLTETHTNVFVRGTSKEIEHHLVFTFFESSTEAMVSTGLPTAVDVQYWKKLIKLREDISEIERICLIELCDDYISSFQQFPVE